MRVGVHVPVFGPLANADNILAVARRAEALGFDSVWSSDHVVMPARVESRYDGVVTFLSYPRPSLS